MAYMSQERKKELAPAIKAVLKKYGMKGTIGVRNYSTLVVNIKSGSIKFEYAYYRFGDEIAGSAVGDSLQLVGSYNSDIYVEPEAREFIKELFSAMNNGNHDRSDVMTDYFDVGWYTQVNIGNWDRPYTLSE